MSAARTRPTAIDERIAGRLRSLVIPCGAIAALIGLAGLAGAIADVDRLRSATLGENSVMTVATSSYLLALGVSVVLMAAGSEREARVAHVIAGIVLALTLMTLVEYVFGVKLGIDVRLNDPAGVHDPGRPEPETAAQFAIGALWLLLYDARGRFLAGVATAAMITISAIALVSLIAYLFAGSYVWDAQGARRISLQGLIAFELLVVGGAAFHPERWWLRPFVLSGAVGVACRRVLPAAVAVPVLGGFLFELASGNQDYAVTLAVAGTVLAEGIALTLAGLSMASGLGELEIERGRLEEELHRMAEHDPLTGVWNRRRFDEELERLWESTRRYGETAAILMLDLDGFKRLNDSHGHGAGDEALRRVAGVILSRLRPGDSVGRLGGDEFAISLERVDRGRAEEVAADIVARIAAARILPNEPSARVSASIGVGMIDGRAKHPGEVLVRADRAMYRDKLSRRARSA